jgi:pimeloyl-ACP methyl ester carboxylesterase
MQTYNRKFQKVLGGLIVATTLATSFISAPTANAAKAKSKKTTKAKKSAPPKATKSTLTWRACDDPIFQCTELAVPVDPANPAGATISLSLVKRPLPAGVEKLGTLLTGNGTPGISGVASMKVDVRNKTIAKAWNRYEVIAFEHRGTGTSSPLGCATESTELGFDAFASQNPANVDAILAKWKSACSEKNPELFRHMGVNDSVADLEAIRVALGEPQLTFQTWNHDATIAAAYASKFPTRVRANVLFDPYPMVDADNYLIDQTAEAGVGIAKFVATCQAAPSCPLSSGAGAEARLDQLLIKLAKSPVPLSADPADGNFTTVDTASMVYASLGDESSWNSVVAALAALETGDAKPAIALDLSFSPVFFPLNRNGGPFWSVACTDGLYPSTTAEEEKTFDRMTDSGIAAAFTYIPFLGFCTDWPNRSARLPQSAFQSNVPTLLLSDRSGSPDKWVTNAALLMPNSSITTYGFDEAGATCIDRTVTQFLEGLVLPAAGTNC